MRGGRRLGGGGLGPRAREQLAAAHELVRQERYADAAAEFNRMAAIARERGMSRMATTLSARAARCFAQVGDQQGLIAATEAAIGDAKRESDADHASRTFGELISGLQGTAFAGAAPDIEGAIRNALGVAPASAGAAATGSPDVNRSMRRHLPSECDGCGAPVSSAEIRFNESGHADCPYCGSILTV